MSIEVADFRSRSTFGRPYDFWEFLLRFHNLFVCGHPYVSLVGDLELAPVLTPVLTQVLTAVLAQVTCTFVGSLLWLKC